MSPTRGTDLSAVQAASALGVTRQTLYAYVSRGQLRSEPVPTRPKERRYRRDDIERLQQLKAARRDPHLAAARGLHWGGPVLESSITLIDGGRLYYRGRDAVRLAETATVEHAAALLWSAGEDEAAHLFDRSPALAASDLDRIRRLTNAPLAQMQAALAAASDSDVAALDLRPEAVRRTGARIVALMASIAGRHCGIGSHVHASLQRAWAADRRVVADVIRAALVLCADHELNVSTFTARCAASAGSSPYDVVAAALAALKGSRHGGASARALALLARSRTPEEARAELADRLRHGEQIPGFGHPLYPDGDPRAALLLRLAAASPNRKAWRDVRNVWRAASGLLRQKPNLDFGLAALTRTYRLPRHAPLTLFALGRTIGWIAHAMEEYASGQLIRPRARYVGEPPAAQPDRRRNRATR